MTILHRDNVLVVANGGEQVNGPHNAPFRDVRGKIAAFADMQQIFHCFHVRSRHGHLRRA